MADTIVSFLIGKIGTFLEQKAAQQTGIKSEIKFVKDELESMRAFLRVAEAMEDKNPQIAVWVKQVRQIAFDIEDLIDEFNYHLARHKQTDERKLLWGIVSRMITCIRGVKYRYQIASSIPDIKSRILSVSERMKRYPPDLLPGEVPSSRPEMMLDQRGDALLIEETEVVGIEEPRVQMMEWLTKGDGGLFVVAVEGMGGLGKTTLVKKVYDHAGVTKHFASHVWITVSQTFKIEELLKDIITQICNERLQSIPEGMETMSSTELKFTIRLLLQERRYLIVLDDMWQIEAWEAIKYAFPRNTFGSRVIVTTRIGEVACASTLEFGGLVYPLKPLSPEDSWTLFCKKAFQGKACPVHLVKTAQDILHRCEGLPLAIVAIGSLLATKGTSLVDEWEWVMHNLSGEFVGNKLGNLKKVLSLSFYELPFYLKACLMHICTFPEDYKIERMRLVRLWIAERFIEDNGRRTLEEVGESYLNELINRNLVQIVSRDDNGRITSCRVHDSLREVILAKLKDQEFAVIIDEQSKRWYEKARRLIVHKSVESTDEERHVYGLRSVLILDGIEGLSTNKPILFNDLKLVKVLDLKGTNIDKFPIEIIKLCHLSYLSLRNTKVKDVPSSIEKLQHLETLDLKGTDVKNLPTTIVNLGRLRHLLVYHYQIHPETISLETYGFQAICGMRKLGCLQQLCCVELDTTKGVMKELGMLTQLRRLWISKVSKEDGETLCSSIDKLLNLRRLTVVAAKKEEILDLERITFPPRYLQRLKFVGRLEKVPHWLPCLTNLIKLSLYGSELKEDVLESTRMLPNLVCLELDKGFAGERLCIKSIGFEKLKILGLGNSEGLKSIEVGRGALPCLEELMILRCGELEDLPIGTEHLKNLQRLELWGLSEGLVNKIDRSKDGRDFWKIQHIPNVRLAYFKGDKWVTFQP